MKFKLDENLPIEASVPLLDAGHDVHTTVEEGLGGTSDPQLLIRCKDESRILMTLDLDFCNILDYPPNKYAGIIVIRSLNQSKRYVLWFIKHIVVPHVPDEMAGRLMIAQKNGIRIR